MSDTNFVDFTTPAVNAEWLNDVNDAVYNNTNPSTNPNGPFSFTANGTGAVARNITAKLKDVVSAKDYGATGDGTTNDTAALQAWLTYCGNNNIAGYLPAGNYKVTSLTFTMTGNRINQSMTLFGDGRNSSRITKISGANPPLTITSSTPGTIHTDAQLSISDIGFFGNAQGSDGLALSGIAGFDLERLLISGFASGLKLYSCLVGSVRNCDVTDNVTGIILRRFAGTGTYCNDLSFDGCRVKYNSAFGVDLAEGSGIWFSGGGDIERNGTTANPATGGMIIRPTVDDETGYAIVGIKDTWFEANFGTGIIVQNTSGLLLSISSTKILSQEAGLAFTCAGARSVSFSNSFALGNTSVFNVTCDKFTIENSVVDVLTDASTSPVYINSSTSTANYPFGKTTSFTATLTGCTTSPTGSVLYKRQGSTVWLTFPLITGTSNTTGATLTGLPAVITPTSNRYVSGIVKDNSVDKGASLAIGSSGVITLSNGFANSIFTAAGTKGVLEFECCYQL